MKKGILLLSVMLLLTGCKSEEQQNNKEDKAISYTNKYECTRTETITKYTIEHRNETSRVLSAEELKEKKESPVAVNVEVSKIYDFNKEGSKLLNFYEIRKYEYLLDYDLKDEEKSLSSVCENYEKYGFKSCAIKTIDNTITITKTSDLKADYNKDLVEKTTLDSIKEAYKDGEIYTCKN